MPVVNFSIDRLTKFFPGIDLNKIVEILPFVALDIESINGEFIRVEYNPNRPDFASEYGIVRALRGLVGIETGIPKFAMHKTKRMQYVVNVDLTVKQIRPFILGMVAKKDANLDDQSIRQLIAMQEDLHNGIGRRRMKASIGIHNLDVIKFPVSYKTVSGDFSFVPVGQLCKQSIQSILKESDIGREYGYILEKSRMKDKYPLVVDEENNVLSFPPIINADLTKLSTNTHNLFIEVTANNQKTAEDVLAIFALTLYEAGFEIHCTLINDIKRYIITPNMDPSYIDVDPNYINRLLGLELKINEILKYLRKSRLNANITHKGKIIKCTIPRYRTDILHPIDIVEEVAIGYGVYNLKPTVPSSTHAGQTNSLSFYINIIRDILVGLEILEVVNFTIVGRKVQYQLTGVHEPNKVLKVDGAKSADHEILRDMLIPSLLKSLSYNVHEEYPQKLFEIGKIFQWSNDINEYWSLGVVVAHNNSGYTEAKSILQTLLKTGFGKTAVTKATTQPIFINGRCANIIVDDKYLGIIGEITPLAIDNFKIRVPVVAFELNLSQLLQL
jgi:phenylalanyl-tRNA synthetase beta chain